MPELELSRGAAEPIDHRGGRRAVEDIMASILSICKKGERKTKIMYGCMLNLRQLNRYLQTLLEKGLVIKDQVTGEYRTTLRGTRYLSNYDSMVKSSRQMSHLHDELLSMLLDKVAPGHGALPP